MKLSVQEGYLTMFWFIDSFYWECKDDDLGTLLGELSPITFVDCISADPAAWEIWNKIISKFDFGDSEMKYFEQDKLLTIIELFLKEFEGECFDLDIIYRNIIALRSDNRDMELLERWNIAIKKGKENFNENYHGLK